MWPMLLDISKDECRGILRRLELEAYAGVLNAFRAQGTLGQKKRDMLDEIRSILHINADRHKAEIRRVTNDETLCTVAERICGGNSKLDWLSEGRRTVPLIPRGRLETAYAALADSIAREAFIKNKDIKFKACTAVPQPKNDLPDHTNVIKHDNEQTILSVPRERTKKRRRESSEETNHEVENKQSVQAQTVVNPRIPPPVSAPTKPNATPAPTKGVPVTTHHHEKNRDHQRKKASQITTNAKIKQLYNSQNKLKSHSYQKYPSVSCTTTKATNVSVPPLHVPKIKTNRGLNPQIPVPNMPKGPPLRPSSQGHVRKVFEPGPNNIESKQKLSPSEQVSEDDKIKEPSYQQPLVTRTVTTNTVVQSNDKVQYVLSSFQKVLGTNQKVNKPELTQQDVIRSVKVLPQQKPVLVTNNRIKQYPNLQSHNGKTVKLVSIAQPNKARPITTLVPVTNAAGKVTISNTSFKPVTLQNVSSNKFTKVQMSQEGGKANVIFLQKPKLGKDLPITLTKDGKEIKLIMPSENLIQPKKEQTKPSNVFVVQAEKNASFAQILQASGIIPPKNDIIIENNQVTNNLENIDEDRLPGGRNTTLYANKTKPQLENNINNLNSTDWEEELDNASSNKFMIRNQSKVKVVGYKVNNGDQVLRIDENLQNTGPRQQDTILCLNSQDTYTIIKDKAENATVMTDSELIHILNGTTEEIENISSSNHEYNLTKSYDNVVKREDIFQKALEQADIKLGTDEEYLDDMENENLNENVEKIYVTERLQGDSSINDHVIYEPIQKHQGVHDTSGIIVEEEEVVVENYYVEQNVMNVDVDEAHSFDIGTTDVEMSLMEVT